MHFQQQHNDARNLTRYYIAGFARTSLVEKGNKSIFSPMSHVSRAHIINDKAPKNNAQSMKTQSDLLNLRMFGQPVPGRSNDARIAIRLVLDLLPDGYGDEHG